MDFMKLKPALVLRRMPRNGSNSSEDVNDFIEQSIHDVAGVYNFINQVVIPVLNGLGQSGTWSDVDPIINGLDGTTLMVDRDYTDTTSPYFYDSGKGRPKTIYETFLRLVSDVDKAFIGINEVKARLGTTDEDSTVPTSQATLSEIETKVNFLNGLVQQIRNANATYLTADQVAAGLADMSIDPLTFNIANLDVIADAGILATKISGVDLTTSYVYVSGVPATYDMRDTVLRLKEWFEDFTGETFTEFSGTNVSLAGVPNTTVVGHISALGTGAVTATNAHGLDIADLTDGSNLLSAPQLIATFDIHPSGVLPAYNGGYAFVPYAFTATKVALTLGVPGSVGLGVVIWVNSGGSASVLYSGLFAGVSPTPGAVFADISVLLAAEDMLYISGVVGDGQNARVQVFGRP